jgi:hypothetical protein
MLVAGLLAGYLLRGPGGGQQGGDGLPPTERAAATQLVHITPWDDVRGEPADSVVLTGEVSGTCFGSSGFLQRFDAWRCTTSDGKIKDPCFVKGLLEPEMLCSTDRGTPERMLRLNLLEPLPELDRSRPEPTSDGSYAGALILVLADGQRCAAIGGATTTVAGQRYSFHCPQGRLYGDPDTRSPVWTISYRAEGAAVLTPVDIAMVYQ